LTSGTYTPANTGPGAEIGTATLLSYAYDNGTVGANACQYRAYLTNIVMKPGCNFANARSLYYNSSNTVLGLADIVTQTSGVNTQIAVLNSPSYTSLVYPAPQKALAAVSNQTFTYRAANTTVAFSNTSGSLVITLSNNAVFPYGNGVLNASQEADIIVIPTQSANSTAKTGTIIVANGAANAVATGSGTAFLTDYVPGDYVTANVGGQVIRRIQSIANNTYMTVNAPWGANTAGVAHKKAYPAGVPVPFANRANTTITISSNSATATISLGNALETSPATTVIYNSLKRPAQSTLKTVQRNCYAYIDTAGHPADKYGPWCLGVPDVFNITAVYKDTAGNVANPNTSLNVTGSFLLDSGQRDAFYGLSYVKLASTTGLTINTGDHLLVQFDAFVPATSGDQFFTVNSYPIDDTSNAATTTITTSQIPLYTATNGQTYDLRDSVDFRPYVANTIPLANTLTDVIGSGTLAANIVYINPSIDVCIGVANSVTKSITSGANVTFSSSNFTLPAPNQNFSCGIQYYLNRVDKIVMDTSGNIINVEGNPAINPSAPPDIPHSMTLGIAVIPPYPSLPTLDGVKANRPDYTIAINSHQHRGYTMADIGAIDKRLTNIEYYTALNLLEKKSADTVIPSASTGLNRFKNGIFADPMNDLTLCAVTDSEFTAAFDTNTNTIVPKMDVNNINLMVQSSANAYVSSNGSVGTLACGYATVFSQPSATTFHNAAEGMWNWTGVVYLYPASDSFFDITTNSVPATTNNAVVASTKTANTAAQVTAISFYTSSSDYINDCMSGG